MAIGKKWLGITAIVLVLIVPLIAKTISGEPKLEVDLMSAAQQEIRPTILASGTLAYRSEVNLTSELVAKVKSVYVKEGDAVSQGQLLMELDPEVYRNAIAREEAGRRQGSISIERQRAALALREKKFERSEKMIAAKVIDQNSFDEDRNQLELAKIELKSSEEALRRADAVLGEAREQLGKTEIRSPISGQIVSLPIKIGETAIPSSSSLAGAQLMKIADTSSIQAELKVDEADIGRISLGQPADIYAAAYPETALKGSVTQIALAPTVEGQGRAYKVTVILNHLPNKVLLRSGMSARANIFLGNGKKRLAVPVEAISTEAGEDKKVISYVWIVRDGRASKVSIRTEESDDRWQGVGKPLAQGDVVVIGPAKTLRLLQPGDRVAQRAGGGVDAGERRDRGATE